jgi:hypothetical protein
MAQEMTRDEIDKILGLHDIWVQDYEAGRPSLGLRADFSDHYLSYTDWRHINLRHANLQGAILQNIDFENADLQGADFTGARLYSVFFMNANLKDANFSDAYLWCPPLDEHQRASAIFTRCTIGRYE